MSSPSRLVANLLRALPDARLIETHISWVIVAGEWAYKIKKPVNLGFLDFSSLARREACCREEIRLNRRLAPHIYIAAIPIGGSESAPLLEDDGEIIEWAVKMRAFPADATLDLAAGISAKQVDAMAADIARLHAEAAVAAVDSDFGSPADIRASVMANFTQIRDLNPSAEVLACLASVQTWSETAHAQLEHVFSARKRDGFVREGHGDLHLGNIAWVDEAPLIFDGIEFNAALRFVDVISDIAFLCMDLHYRGFAGLAWRLLDQYLQQGGDYAGLRVLPYYLVYRAMVRAKVAAIRARQDQGDLGDCLAHLRLAQQFCTGDVPALILMHGVCGSGKSVLAQTLLEPLGAIRLRSDVERKRLFGLSALEDSRTIPGDIYTREAGARTREHLLALTGQLLDAQFRVIVDATFISPAWRQPFEACAQTRNLAWCFVSPQVDPQVLRQRVRARSSTREDASEADEDVLSAQLAGEIPLDAQELRHTVAVPPTLSGTALIRAVETQLFPVTTSP